MTTIQPSTVQLIKLAIEQEPGTDIRVSQAAMFELGAEELIDEFTRENYRPGQQGAVGVKKKALKPFLDAAEKALKGNLDDFNELKKAKAEKEAAEKAKAEKEAAEKAKAEKEAAEKAKAEKEAAEKAKAEKEAAEKAKAEKAKAEKEAAEKAKASGK